MVTINDLNKKFAELSSMQIVPAHYYCMHRRNDTDRFVYDPNTNECVCNICGHKFTFPDNINLKDDMKEIISKLDSFLNLAKISIGPTSEDLSCILSLIDIIKNLKLSFNEINEELYKANEKNPMPV